MLAFVPVMLVAAVATWRAPGDDDDGGCPHPPLARVVVAGLGVGALTGFFGVGGGFVIVPVLTLWLGAPFRRAVATSLVIITLTGLAALASHLLDRLAARTWRSRPSWRSRPASARCSARWSASGCRSRCCGAGSPWSSPSALALLFDVLVLGGPPG